MVNRMLLRLFLLLISFFYIGDIAAKPPSGERFTHTIGPIDRNQTTGSDNIYILRDYTATDVTDYAPFGNRVTAVSMPDISVPVLCWPASLSLSSKVTSPRSGNYRGELKIVFTPSSTY